MCIELNSLRNMTALYLRRDNKILMLYRIGSKVVKPSWCGDLVNPEIHLPSCNEGILEWVDIDHIMERDMPFSAKEMFRHYLPVRRYNEIPYGGFADQDGLCFKAI